MKALESVEFSQTIGRDGKPIGWWRLRPDVTRDRGGVTVTITDHLMIAALALWYEQREAELTRLQEAERIIRHYLSTPEADYAHEDSFVRGDARRWLGE